MAIPKVTCNTDIEISYSVSPQLVTMGATATGSPYAWRWEILSVPYGSNAKVGVNVDFINGVATIQAPGLYVDGEIDGGYVIRCVATNTEGNSNPDLDLSDCEQQILVKTRWYQLYLPGDYSRNWGQYLIDKTLRIIESVLHLHEINVSNPHSVTKTQVSLGSVTNDSQLKRAAGDFNSFTLKSTPISADILLLEDSSDTFTKKKVAFSSFGTGGVTEDTKSKVTTSDTTTSYLDSKVTVANGLQKSVLNPSGNEQLQLSPTYGTAVNTVCQGNDSRLTGDRTASGIRTATTVVYVSSATAPTAGQVLTATGSNVASWQDSTGGGSIGAVIEMLNKAPSTALTKNVNGFDAVGYPGIDEPGDMFEEFYVSKPGVYFVMVKVNFCIDVGTGAAFRLVFDYDTTPIYVTDASWKLYKDLVPTPVLISNFVCTVNLAVGTHNVKIDWSAITGSTISTSPNYFNWKIQAIYTGGLGLPVVMLNKAPIAGRVTSGTSFTGIGYPVVPEPGDMYEILSPSVVAGVYFLVVKICIGVGAGANLGKFRLVFDYDTTPIYVTDNSWQIYTTSSNTYEFTGMVTLPSLPIGNHNVKIEWRAYTGSNFGAGTECSWKIQALLITT